MKRKKKKKQNMYFHLVLSKRYKIKLITLLPKLASLFSFLCEKSNFNSRIKAESFPPPNHKQQHACTRTRICTIQCGVPPCLLRTFPSSSLACQSSLLSFKSNSDPQQLPKLQSTKPGDHKAPSEGEYWAQCPRVHRIQ